MSNALFMFKLDKRTEAASIVTVYAYTLDKAIEKAIAACGGYRSSYFLVEATEVQTIASCCPSQDEAVQGGETE